MLLFRSGRLTHGSWFVGLMSIFLSILISAAQMFAQSKGHKGKQSRATATSAASPDEQSLKNIPLPIGHEAKGLVLPDFDSECHLRGRFEAGTAHRIDECHVGFQQLKRKRNRRRINYLAGATRCSPMNRLRRKFMPMKHFLIRTKAWASLVAA